MHIKNLKKAEERFQTDEIHQNSLGQKLAYLQEIITGVEVLRTHRMDYRISIEGKNEFKTVLKLFQIRLREITKINAVPAMILGLGLDGLLLISGGGTWIEYLVILVTLLSMSLFFSIHYLTLYYLLQPFNAGTEIKSGTYQFIAGATYFVCYLLMKVELPTILFGLLCIAFCLIYSIIACALVYQLAPKTFRIRQ